jgi:hypothetical protein
LLSGICSNLETVLLASIISLILFSGPQRPENSSRVRESTIYFRWDKTNYEDNYLGNTDAADKLLSLLEEIGTGRVDSVSVVAYASPEGVYEHNLLLSRQRAREFNTAVRQRIGLSHPDIPITVTPGGEAWEQLRYRVAADSTMSAAAKDRTLKLLDDESIPRDTKKWRMQHNALGNTREEGDVYHWLLLNHYRYLRCLAIQIYYHDAAPYLPEETAGQAGSDDVSAIPDSTLVVPETAGQAGSDVTAIPDSTNVIPDSDRESHIPEVPEFIAEREGTPIIGISTNLIFDATWIPNYGFTSVPSLSLEYYPARGHWTFGADVDWSHWLHYDTHRFNQIHNITLHARRYFRTGEDGFRGLYLTGALNAAEYGLGWDAHGWEGELLGVNAGIGHKWNWGRFFLDTGLDLGVFYSRYDPYVWGNDETGWYYYDYIGDPAEFMPRRKQLTWFGPTRAYISIGFDLFTRKR